MKELARRALTTASLLTVILPLPQALAEGSRPNIEIHPVISCKSNPQSLPLKVDLSRPDDCLSPEVIVGGSDFIDANRVTNSQMKADALRVTLSLEGERKFYRYTLAHVFGRITIVIDGRSSTAINIVTPVLDSHVQIPGLSSEEIDTLAKRFKS